MFSRMRYATVGLVLAAAPVWAQESYGKKATGDEGATAQAQIGKPAPEFALKDLDGKEHNLSDFKGKIVVLEWINHECPVVNRCHNAHTMSSAIEKFKGKPVEWISINSSHFIADKASQAKKWMEEQKISYPMLLDADGKVGRMYGAKTTPHMFVIDQKGNLAYMGAIDNEPTTEDKSEVRNYVVDAVTALLNGSAVATAETKPYGCSVKYKG